jgi:hypothetical protein
MGWSAKFTEPIPLPKGKRLVTLRDAARHVVREFKTDRKETHWGKRKLARDR